MTLCLYCRTPGPFNTAEHVVPESLGNDNLILTGCVCDSCQAYFGKEVEQYVLMKTPIAFWRTIIGIRTKKGQLPSVDMSQPSRSKGILADKHIQNDDIRLTSQPDGSTSVAADDSLVRALLEGRKRQFNLVLTPKKLSMLGRFLGKVGLGVLGASNPSQAYNQRFDRIRAYARHGSTNEIWPIFHYSEGDIGKWKKPALVDAWGDTLVEEIECYCYELLEVANKYTLFRFSIGLDSWIIVLDDPYPSPIIRTAFPDRDIHLIWYTPEQWTSYKATPPQRTGR